MSASPQLVNGLQTTLADGYTFYLRAHGYHWNVVGSDFAQLHELFETIYEDVYGSLDAVAENLRKIEAFAPYQLTQFEALRTIKDTTVPPNAQAMVADLLTANALMLATLQRTFDAATAANEQGIANFIAERLDMHQKWAWQLRSTLGRA